MTDLCFCTENEKYIPCRRTSLRDEKSDMSVSLSERDPKAYRVARQFSADLSAQRFGSRSGDGEADPAAADIF